MKKILVFLLFMQLFLPVITVNADTPDDTHLWVVMPSYAYAGVPFTVNIWCDADAGIASVAIYNVTFSRGNCTGVLGKGSGYFFGSNPMFYDDGTIYNSSNYIYYLDIGDLAYSGEGNGQKGNYTLWSLTFNTSTTGVFSVQLPGVIQVSADGGGNIGCTRHNNSIIVTSEPSLPGYPTSINSDTYGSTYINLTWTNGTGATNTIIASATGNWPTDDPGVATINETSHNWYNFTGLTPGETYYFRLWGWNTSGYSASSNTHWRATSSTGGNPDPPTGITAIAFNGTRIDISWSGPLSDVDRYVLCGGTSLPSDPDTNQLYNGPGYNYQHGSQLWPLDNPIYKELTPSTTYYYRVWTYNITNNLYSIVYRETSATTETSGINNPPELTSEDPSDGETNVYLTPPCDLVINDQDGDLLDVYFYSRDETGWILEETWLSLYPGTYPYGTSKGFTYINATEYNTLYYWRVCCYDGDSWTNETYTFTTMSPLNVRPNIPLYPHPENSSTSIYPLVNLSVAVTDNDGDELDVYFFNANTSQVLAIQEDMDYSVYNVPSGERAWMWYNVAEDTTFYWYTRSWDGSLWSNTSDIWHFTTIDASPGYHSPNLPSNPSPYHNQLNIPINTTLSWYISHPDGPREMLVELWIGVSPDDLYLEESWSRYGNQTMTYLLTDLTYNDDYYWRVDVTGTLQPYTIVGDTWRFHTGTTTGYQIMFQTYYIDSTSGLEILMENVNISYYFPESNATYIYMGHGTTDSDGIATINTGAGSPILYYWDFTPPAGYVGMKKVPILVDPDNPKIQRVRMYRTGEANTITTMVTVWERGNPFPLTGVTLTVLPGYPIPDAGTYSSGNGSSFQLIYYEPSITSGTTKILLSKSGYHNLTAEIDIVNWKNHNLYMYRYGAIHEGNASTWEFTDFFDIFGTLRDNAGIITGGDNELGASIIVIIILAMVFYFAYTRVQLYGAVVVVFFIALIFILTGFVGWKIIIIPLIPVLIPFASKFASGIVGNRVNNNNGG